MQKELTDWVRPEIKKLVAYPVANADGLIKLDAMENPYGLPHSLQQALFQRLVSAPLNRYPDPGAKVLTKILIKQMDIPVEKAVILGNGSDELIQLLVMAVARPGACLLSFEPGFVMYRMIAEFVGVQYIGVPLTTDFNLDMAVTCEAIKRYQPAIIFIAYPNNPSANLFNADNIEEIIRLAPGLVVVDEAYHPFAQTSFMPKLTEFDNLLILRTVSKMGLAGIRLGLLCGLPKIINEIDKIRLPYNINVLTQTVALYVFENITILEQQASQIRQQRSRVYTAMQAISALEVFPSQANFILFRVLNKAADDVFESIKRAGVLIKNMKAEQGVLKHCLRVTIGTPEENNAFLAALETAIN